MKGALAAGLGRKTRLRCRLLLLLVVAAAEQVHHVVLQRRLLCRRHALREGLLRWLARLRLRRRLCRPVLERASGGRRRANEGWAMDDIGTASWLCKCRERYYTVPASLRLISDRYRQTEFLCSRAHLKLCAGRADADRKLCAG